MKPFKETKLGKILSSKGVDKVFDIAENVGIPGAKVLNDIKDWAVNASPSQISAEEKKEILELVQEQIKELDMLLEDVQNARSREVEIAKTGKREWLMPTVVIIGLMLFLGSYLIIAFKLIPEANRAAFDSFTLTIRDIGFMIFAYFMGSSQGSKRKTELIDKLT